jgi:hypothetical protein
MRSVIVSSFAPDPDGKIGRRNPVYRTGLIAYPAALLSLQDQLVTEDVVEQDGNDCHRVVTQSGGKTG